MAVLNGGFVQYARVESDCVVRKPAHCRIEQAAALPIAYLTAYYALVVRANLQPGERVLIHSAAGALAWLRYILPNSAEHRSTPRQAARRNAITCFRWAYMPWRIRTTNSSLPPCWPHRTDRGWM